MSRDPQDPIEGLQREVERLFHSLVYRRHPASHFTEPTWTPPADLVVSRNSARVLLELAGVPREHVRVRIRGRVLEVTGRRDPPERAPGAHYHRAEISFGEFRRVIELPWEADPARVQAYYRDGMLEIGLRPVPAGAPREIEVEGRTP